MIEEFYKLKASLSVLWRRTSGARTRIYDGAKYAADFTRKPVPRLIFTTVAGGAVVLSLIRANDASTAICALRVDYANRIEQQQKFLDSAPPDQKILKFGTYEIPRITIQNNIANQRRTAEVLKAVHCKELDG